MSVTDQISELFQQGVVSITIAISPKKTIYVQASQVTPTGAGSDHVQVTHQADDAALPELLNKVAAQVEHVNELKTHIIQPRGGNGR